MAKPNLHLLLFSLCQARSKDQHQHCARIFLKKKQAVQPSQSLFIRGSQVVGPKWLRQFPKLLYFLHAHLTSSTISAQRYRPRQVPTTCTVCSIASSLFASSTEDCRLYSPPTCTKICVCLGVAAQAVSKNKGPLKIA